MQGLTPLPRGLGHSVEVRSLPWSGKVPGELEEEKEMYQPVSSGIPDNDKRLQAWSGTALFPNEVANEASIDNT